MNYELGGWIVSALSVLPVVASGVMMILGNPRMVNNMERVGFSRDRLLKLGIVKLVIVLLYLVPQTSFFGAILVTGWMGGAIAAHVRIRDHFVVQALIPTMAWIGFGLRHHEDMARLIGLQ